MKIATYKQTKAIESLWKELNDVDRWGFLKYILYWKYVVLLDNDATIVKFLDGDGVFSFVKNDKGESVSLHFSDWIGNDAGVFSLLEAMNIPHRNI